MMIIISMYNFRECFVVIESMAGCVSKHFAGIHIFLILCALHLAISTIF